MMYTASNFQNNLWVMAQANDKNNVNYNISSAYTIYGEINYEQLQKSVIAVFERHFLFRCRFQLKDKLIFEPQFDLNWLYFFEDYSECSAEEKKRNIAQTLQVEMRYEFDVSVAPLIRVTCIKTDAAESILIITMHHLISDGVSFVLFIEDLMDEYFSAHGPMAERQTSQFSDYLVNTASAYTVKQFEGVVSYWQQQVKQLENLQLPYDFSRPKVQQFMGGICRTVLSETLQSKLRQYAQHQGVTLFMCMLTAYAMLLHRYTGQTHFCVGTPVNLRRKIDARVIGPCINMLPLAFEITSVDSFADSLQMVKLALLTALEHRYISLDTLVGQLEIPYDASQNPLFQTIFVWQNLANSRFEQDGLCFEPLDTHHGFVKLDLEFYVKETNNQLHLYCEYKSSLFTAETIDVMVQQYIDLLKEVVGESTMPSLSYAPGPISIFRELSVIQLFEEQVMANPAKTCLVYEDVLGQKLSLSYEQFNRKVNRLAHSLQTKINKQSIIAIVFERSLEMMLSIYAISKLGSSYLPIDPSWPIERIKEVLLDASPALILSHNACAHLLDVPFLDVMLHDRDDRNSDNLLPLNALETLPAYVIYTSGSTGKPKGVVNNHFALINRLLWMRDACKVTDNDIILQKTPYSFDVSVWEIFLPLMTGATLIISPPGSHRDCLWLQQIILRHQVTMLHFVPSMLNAYLADRDSLLQESLRVVICSGEELSTNTVDDFYQIFKHVELYNLYGPTEACIDVTYWQCQANYGRKIPIGKPISNTQIYILDQQLNPVPTLAKGEIYIAGVNLALGYLYQPALTAERFFEHVFADGRCERLYKTGDYGRYTPDGLIMYLGRVDDMIKMHGNRIELAEIEAKLFAHPNVKNAAVIVKASQEPYSVACLIAFVELVDPKQATNELVLKTYLSSRLPLYMLCSAIIILDQIPHTSSGKIDKKTLQAMKFQLEEAVYVEVVTKAELLLQDAWSATLRKDPISRFDNFFRLGGDSIRIMQMLSLLRKQGVQLSVQQVYTCENLCELAKHMVFEQPLENNHLLIPFSLIQPNAHSAHEDAYPLSLLQQAIYYFQQERKYAYHVYATWYLIESKLDRQLLQSAVDQVVDRHPILKSHIDTVNYTEWVQVVINDVRVKINLFDLSFLDSEAAKDYMAIWLQDDQSTPFDWSLAPLLRISVHQLANQQFYLTLTEPWLDGWSVSIVGQEILTIYAGLLEQKPITLPDLSTNYAYYVQQERLAAQDEIHKRFWHDYLKDAEPCYLERVEFDSNQRFRAYRESIVFPEHYLVNIKRIAIELNVSIKHVLLAAHLFLMRFLTGKDEIITGLMSNARPEVVGVEHVVGLFLNAVPFRMQVKNQSWANLIKAVYTQESQLMPHRFYPSAQIRQDHANTALFNTLFNFTDFHLYRDVPNTPQFALKDVFGNDQTYYLLTCHFSISFNGQYLKLDLDSNQNCDSIAWLNDMTQSYQTILDLMSTDSASLCQNFYLTYRYPSGLEGDYLPIANTRLIDYFTQRVQNSPQQIAIIEKNQTYTYQDLSNVVANLIQQIANVMPVDQVVKIAVMAPRSVDLVAAILCTLTLNATYIPINPQLPQNKIQAILDDATPTILLEKTAEGEMRCSHYMMSKTKRAPQNPAVIMYTSGSTGKPKGVVLSETAIYNRFAWMWSRYPFNANDVVCAKTAINFIDSVWELLGGLFAGVQTVIVNDTDVYDLSCFTHIINHHAVTRITMVPVLLNAMLHYCQDIDMQLDTLTLCISSGEVLSTQLARLFHAISPKATLLNLYGSTEVAGDITYYEINHHETSATIPIGTPLSNNQITIVGDNGYPIPCGYIGHIMVRGLNLTNGYTDALATKDAFSVVKQSGLFYKTGDLGAIDKANQLIYLGRKDRQLKIRGIRIEAFEVEHWLNQHPAIKQSCVVIKRDQQDEPRLLAYYTLNEGSHAVHESELRDQLALQLQREAMPEFFIHLQQFPLTSTGKINQSSLVFERLNEVTNADDRVLNETEKKLFALWQETLGTQFISAERDFFMNGGHSLKVMQLLLRIKRVFGVEVSLNALFVNKDLKTMSRLLTVAAKRN